MCHAEGYTNAPTSRPTPQSGVLTDPKAHAAFITIHLSGNADRRDCARRVARMESLTREVVPEDEWDEDTEILTSVGFGQQMWNAISSRKENFLYRTREGHHGTMPATGGDIFVHVKSAVPSNVFEMTRLIKDLFQPEEITSFDDRYGFVYKNGRDLSGFIDGTANLAGDAERIHDGLNERGGSFAITQRWIHKFNDIRNLPVDVQEKCVGRTKEDSQELDPRPESSHVARMVGYHKSGPRAGEKIQIFRQSMPYGRLGGEAGLFFIAYTRDPYHFDFMLDRMVGHTADQLDDDIMMLSRCVTGNFWYIPSKDELAVLAA